MKYTLSVVLFCVLSCCMQPIVNAQTIAFPGAEGFGKYAKGGRGGKVVEVTNLADSGVGSFRWAFLQHPDTPITIVFRVSGIIDLASPIKVNRSFITVAGQTAPGDGICLRGNSLIINGARLASLGGNHGHIIIRYIRSRPGAWIKTGVYGIDLENCHNVIIDHCSFSWANEECAALYDTKNTTVQWNIISEGLYNANHQKGVRSYCGVWGGQYASYHHNLIAHNNNRTVRFNGARAHDTIAIVDYRNNVIYNWGSSSSCYGGEIEIPNGVSNINIVNNYYKPGPATASTLKFVRPDYPTSSVGVAQWHVKGNIMAGDTAKTNDNWKGVDFALIPAASRVFAKKDTAFVITDSIQTQSAADAYDSVLAKVGAILPFRDCTDARVINEARNKTAVGLGSLGKLGIIDTPSAVGGWCTYNTYQILQDTDHDGMPDNWELANGLNPNNPDDRNDTTTDGYTKLEVYLNGITQAAAPVPVKLVDFKVLPMSQQVQLHWQVAEIEGNETFEVEVSANGQNFETISKVQAKAAQYMYQFVLPSSIKSGFVRLKVVTKQGEMFYSSIKQIRDISSPSFSIFPNPAKTFVTINWSTTLKENVEIAVFNELGICVSKAAISKQNQLNQYSINTNKWVNGTYTIVVQGEGWQQTSNFIKQ